MTPGVDVVVVTYQSAAHLARCVSAVQGWDRVASVTVVDNASSDGSAGVAEALGADVIRMPDNVGFGSGQNAGVAAGTAPYVLLLNPDAVVDVDGLAAGARLLDDPLNGQVAAVQGAVRRAADGGLERSSGREPGVADLLSRLLRLRQLLGEERLKRLARRAGAAYFADRQVAEETSVDFLAAVALLVRREAFRSVGGFDQRFFLYAEDIDLCRRLRLAGWRLVARPGPWAEHVGGASSHGARGVQRRRWWDAHLLFVRVHWKGPRRWVGLVLGRTGRTLAMARLSG